MGKPYDEREADLKAARERLEAAIAEDERFIAEHLHQRREAYQRRGRAEAQHGLAFLCGRCAGGVAVTLFLALLLGA